MADVGRTDGEAEGLLLQHLDFVVAVPHFRPGRRGSPPIRFETAEDPHLPAAVSLTPPGRGLQMPRQDLTLEPAKTPALDTGEITVRRLIVIAAALGFGLLVSKVLLEILGWAGLTAGATLVIVLSGLLSTWTGFGFINAVAGVCVTLAERRRPPAPGGRPDPGHRTAILVPVYNEDPGRVLAAVEAMALDLRRSGFERLYDIFLLSDTRDAALAAAETAGVMKLAARLVEGPQVYYRRRAINIDRKAGNIADWLQSHGAGYEHMLVLDADSLMAAETIAALTAAMEADPRLGLLQTVPTIVNATTLFARLQQFASSVYGPVFAHGQAWWSGSEGNYWGHNAIIRVRAFAESAGLPRLIGPKPFDGHIMSHDFVEAALLRRRGWAVRTVAGLPGSYEEAPPTLLDAAARDRRWCQGNLQHLCLIEGAGLHWVSRMHLVLGAFAYLAPVLWLTLMISGAGVWPEALAGVDAPRVVGLFVLTLGLVLAPRLMALGLALSSPEQRRGFGGAGRLIAGVLAETLASTLIAPVMMVMQSTAVAEVLVGRDSGWSSQRRDGAALGLRDAWRAHGGHVALGAAGCVLALLADPFLLVWAGPVFLSLILSPMLSLYTSRPRRAGRWGLFEVPEDSFAPLVLRLALNLRRRHAAQADARDGTDGPFPEPAMAAGIGADRDAIEGVVLVA